VRPAWAEDHVTRRLLRSAPVSLPPTPPRRTWSAYPLTSFPPSDDDNVVLQWNNEALECIRALRTSPPVSARALFIIHSAAYDA
jgi:hypothetical protein